MLTDRDDTFQAIRNKLLKAQENMKKQADGKRREMQYEIGDWVLLKLRPRRHTTVKGLKVLTGKLAQRYYEPFQVTERLGLVAYKLQFPECFIALR